MRTRHGHSDSTCWPQAPSATRLAPAVPVPHPAEQGTGSMVALQGLQSCDTAPVLASSAGPWQPRQAGWLGPPPERCHQPPATVLKLQPCHQLPATQLSPIPAVAAPSTSIPHSAPHPQQGQRQVGCGTWGGGVARSHQQRPPLPADCSRDTATPVPCCPAGQVRSPPKPASPSPVKGSGCWGRGRMCCCLPVPAGMGRHPHCPDRASSASGEGEQRTRTIHLTWQFLDLR